MDDTQNVISLEAVHTELLDELGATLGTDGLLDVEQKFAIALVRAKNSGHAGDYKQALEIAKSIEDPALRSNLLLSLLEEIEEELVVDEIAETEQTDTDIQQ